VWNQIRIFTSTQLLCREIDCGSRTIKATAFLSLDWLLGEAKVMLTNETFSADLKFSREVSASLITEMKALKCQWMNSRRRRRKIAFGITSEWTGHGEGQLPRNLLNFWSSHAGKHWKMTRLLDRRRRTTAGLESI